MNEMTHETDDPGADEALEASSVSGHDGSSSASDDTPQHSDASKDAGPMGEDKESTAPMSGGPDEDLDASVRAFLDTAPPELTEWATATAARLGTQTPALPAERRKNRRVPTVLIVLLLVPVVIWGVYKMGAPPQSNQAALTGSASSMPSMPADHGAPELDAAAVAEMETRLEADPTDIEAMSELGKLHLLVGDFAEAGQWQQRILADHPEDVDARLALGVALYNQDEEDNAQEQWERAAELDPSKAEPHYNLGFLHLSSDPPDMEKVSQHWNKVLELAPDSSMAETITAHMGGLEGLEPPAQDDP